MSRRSCWRPGRRWPIRRRRLSRPVVGTTGPTPAGKLKKLYPKISDRLAAVEKDPATPAETLVRVRAMIAALAGGEQFPLPGPSLFRQVPPLAEIVRP